MKRQRIGRISRSIIRKEPPVVRKEVTLQVFLRGLWWARPDLAFFAILYAALVFLLVVKIALGAIWGIDLP